MVGSLKMQNRLVLRQTVFCWIDWVSGCLTHHIRLMLLPFPLRPAERSILFSEKSVRLSDDVRSTASSHAPKIRMRSEGSSRSEPARRGRLPLLTFFGEAKKVPRRHETHG